MITTYLALLATLNTCFAKEQKPVAINTIQTPVTAAFEINTQAKQFGKVKTIMLHVGTNQVVEDIAKTMHFDLEFSDQLAIDLKRTAKVPTAKQAAALAKQGYALMLVIEDKKLDKKNVTTTITLKDPANDQLFFSKEYTCLPKNVVMQGHTIANELMPVLTNESGPMLSTLAYCKQIANDYKIVCIADYACRLERPVVTARTINVAPSWHSKAPGLCYSQFTRVNSRLMYTDLVTKAHKVVCSYDGLNMQPSFSNDGAKAALCLSSKGNSEIYLYDQHLCKAAGKRVFKQLTHNNGNNVSPCLMENGNLIFCSDFQTGSPQIYLRDAQTLAVKRLTSGTGYCASPTYHEASGLLVYTRYIKGAFQLFALNLQEANPVERQLTKSPGDKLEPTISACGKYVAFTYQTYDNKVKKRTSQIAVFNTRSNVMRVLTSSPEQKSYPAWTGRNLYC